jgi:predicted patatin/cPLA2 family phospholipase
MKTYFTTLSIVKYEIWTGIYNQDLQKFRLCCNRHKNQSLIHHQTIDYELTQSMKPYFCDGDIDKITNCGLASAAIPGIIQPVIIDKHHYSDGALYGASPLSVCQNIILKLTPHQPLHITYINSKDLSQAHIKPNYNLFDTWIAAVNNLIKSQTLLDRLIAHELLFNNKEVNTISFECTYDNLIQNQEKRKHCQFSLLEIYPTKESDIDITCFTGEDVVRNLKLMFTSCQCHFWWVD